MSEPTITFQVQANLSQFKVPTELIKKNFKNIQKLVEKQRKSTFDDIAKITKNSALPPQMKLKLVQKAITSLEVYKAKLTTLEKLDQDYRSRLKARNIHLQQLSKYTTDGEVLDLNNYNLISWYREETQLAIVDYLIKSSDPDYKTNTQEPEKVKKESSNNILSPDHPNIGVQLLYHLLQQQKDLSKLIDFDVYSDFNRIYLLISQDHTLDAVSTWFNDNKQQLKKVNSNLDFEIKYCKLLSLIESGNVSEAIAYSHTNLLVYGNKDAYDEGTTKLHFESNLQKMEKIGAYLVYLTMKGAAPIWVSTDIALRTSSFKELETSLAQGRWILLAQCFVDDFTVLYGIPKNYPLYIYLLAGLSSLKTKSCYCNQENDIFAGVDTELATSGAKSTTPETASKSKSLRAPDKYYHALEKVNNCPVCSPELYQLSRNLPYAQMITLIFNNPFMLPNGNIYPFNKLLQSQSKVLLKVACIEDPLTKEPFHVDDCKRVYPA